MRTEFEPHFERQFAKLPLVIQKKFQKQAAYLLHDLRHPSLRAKKYDEIRGIWQARVDDHYRFYFRIDSDRYVLLTIRRHKD